MNRAIISLFFIFPFFSLAFNIDTNKYKSVETLIAQNAVNIQFEGLGGHSGECVKMIYSNTNNHPVYMWIEGGRRLKSEDNSLQDLFLIENKVLALLPGSTGEVKLKGFCCQASNGGPGEGSAFTVGEMAPPLWVKMANYIEDKALSDDVIQSAVWVLSDSIALSSISGSDEASILLKKKVANWLGIELPWWSIAYEKIPNQVFSNRPNLLFGDVDFYVNTHCVVAVVIKDPYGKNLAWPMQEKAMSPGEYTFKLKQDILGWEKGRYTLNIFQDRRTMIKQKAFYL